jgi:hypothetical protein
MEETGKENPMALQIDQSKPEMMQEGADLKAIRNPRLPLMAAAPQEPAHVKGEQMPKDPAVKVPSGEATMSPFDPKAAAEPQNPKESRQEMKGHTGTAATQASGQSYLRLRMRVAGDRLSVIDVQEVEGPLVQSGSVAGEYAYEAQLDAKPLAAEGILDVGVSRSYPRPGTNEHFITQRSTFDFNVRLPRAEVPDTSVPRLSIMVYRFADTSPKMIQGRISAQPGLQALPVAQLQGIKVESLEPGLREKFQKVFPRLVLSR